MIHTAGEATSGSDCTDPALVDIVEEIGRLVELGQPVPMAKYVADFPDQAEYLRGMLVTLREMKDLGNALASSSGPLGPTHKRLGDFQIIRQIGCGGMGVVYEADQISLDRKVALKVLRLPGILDDKALNRFKNEARAAATLDHPHIVHVIQVGCDRGVHCLAMQLIDGPSLAEVIEAIKSTDLQRNRKHSDTEFAAGVDTKFSSDPQNTKRESQHASNSRQASSYMQKVTRWGIQAAEALAYAHENGVIHRDIKPGNLLLDRQGQVWIADFGLARFESNATLTATGQVFGTTRYMSPEQLFGKRTLVDHRSDIYSLGATLYELLTLVAAFPGDNRHLLINRIANEEPRPLRSLQRDIPFDLENIVLKAMAKDPANRYESAQDLADDLARFQQSKPVLARKPSLANRMVKWVRRNPLVSLSATVIFVALTFSLGLAVWSTQRVTSAANVTQRLLYLADMHLATIALEKNNIRQARELLSRHIPSSGKIDHRGFAWRMLWRRAHPANRTFAEHQAEVLCIACSPTNSLVASGDEEGHVLLWDRQTGRVEAEYAFGKESIVDVAFWPDGKFLFLSTEAGDVIRLDLLDGSFASGKLPDGDFAFRLHCLAEKNLIAGLSADGAAAFWLANDMQQTSLRRVEGEDILALHLYEDSERLISAKIFQRNSSLILWDEVTQRLIQELELPASLRCATFSVDGARVACGTSRGHVLVFEVENGQEICRVQLSPQRIYDLSFDTTGNLLAAASKDACGYLLDIDRGEVIQSFPGHSRRIFQITFSPKANALCTASGDMSCKVFSALGSESSFVQTQVLDCDATAISPDAKTNLEFENSGALTIEDDDGKRFQLAGRHVFKPAVTFSPDGSLLMTHANQLVLDADNHIGLFDNTLLRVDVDRDGDLDWVGALGHGLREVWQESNPAYPDLLGPIHTFEFGDNQQVAQRCERGQLRGSICQMLCEKGVSHVFGNKEQLADLRVENEAFNGVLLDDLDGDGHCDFLYRKANANLLTLCANVDREAHRVPTRIKAVSPSWWGSYDLDGDQLRDLVVADSEAGAIGWYRHRGAFQFGEFGALATGLEQPELVYFHDVDQDGGQDLITSDGGIVVWLRRQGPLRFAAAQPLEAALTELPFVDRVNNLGIWNCDNGSLVRAFNSLSWNSTDAAFTHDNGFVATYGRDRTVRVFSVNSGELVAERSFPGDRGDSLAFSPDGEYLGLAHGDVVSVWKWREFDSAPIRLADHESTVCQILFDPSGKKLATLSHDQTAKIWDFEAGRPIANFFDIDGRPLCACWIEDGSTLAIGSDAGQFSLWDVASGQMLTSISGFEGRLYSLGYDGEALVGILYDAGVHRRIVIRP
ncbi:MAG: protein kinase [bacterium]|nr:protein kinase [bacterium]